MNKEIIKQLDKEMNDRFVVINTDYINDHQIAYDVNAKEFHSILSHLKMIGWTQLSTLTCVDFIKDNHFQLVAVLFNWEKAVYIQLRILLNRDKPLFRTITTIYPGAQYYEREVHEMFGVEFEGNEDSYKNYFLELWDDMPPLRKDFNSRAYSDKKYAKREYTASYVNKKEGAK
jgi:NADH-quinone oxidoreductase subunit C